MPMDGKVGQKRGSGRYGNLRSDEEIYWEILEQGMLFE
jgi:hypothetical protein